MSGYVPRRRQGTALAGQFRVLHALVIREMQLRFGQSRLGYVWLVGEPLMLCLGISAMHWASGHGLPNDLPIFLFYGLSYAPFYMFRAILSRNAGAIHSGRPLLYHHSIKLHDLTMSRTILDAAACIPVILLLVVGGILYGGYWPAHPGLFVLSLLLSALLGHGLGTFVAAMLVFYEPLERLVHPMTYLMMPISGAFAMVDTLPKSAQDFLLWVPLVHVHEAMRYAQWGDLIVAHYNIPYVLLWVLILNCLGMIALRAARPYVTTD